MAYRPDLSDLGPHSSPNHERHLQLVVGSEVVAPNGWPSRNPVRDTWNTGVIDELNPQPTLFGRVSDSAALLRGLA